MKSINIQISPKTIFTIFLVIFGIYLGLMLTNVIVIVMFCYIITSAIRPSLAFFEKYKIPRSVSIVFILILSTLLTSVLLYSILSELIIQANLLRNSLPELIKNLFDFINSRLPENIMFSSSTVNEIIAEASDRFNLGSNFDIKNVQDLFAIFVDTFRNLGLRGIEIIGSTFESALGVFAIFVTSLYMLGRKESVGVDFVQFFLDKQKSENVLVTLKKVEKVFADWLLSKIISMSIVGFLTYLAFIFPAVFSFEGYNLHKYAVLLGFLAAFLELFPNIGPTIMSFIGALLTLAIEQNWGILIYVSLALILIQQLESLWITPKIVKKVVDLDPILTITGVIGGFTLGGILGAVLSVPIIASVKIIITDYLASQNKKSTDALS